jgi:hypothetical protein
VLRPPGVTGKQGTNRVTPVRYVPIISRHEDDLFIVELRRGAFSSVFMKNKFTHFGQFAALFLEVKMINRTVIYPTTYYMGRYTIVDSEGFHVTIFDSMDDTEVTIHGGLREALAYINRSK